MCACGQRGCLETYASGAAIARRYRARRGAAPGLSAQHIAAARGTDPWADQVWRDATTALGIALASATMLLDPELIVLGGGLATAGDVLLDPVREELAARLTWRARASGRPFGMWFPGRAARGRDSRLAGGRAQRFLDVGAGGVIVTVCLNPAIDVTYRVPELSVGRSHRVREVHTRAGGKGINVARVLHQLAEPVTIAGLCGGTTGAEIAADLQRSGLRAVLTPISGQSRRTVTVVDAREATVLNEPGPQVSAAEWAAFSAAFSELVQAVRVVVHVRQRATRLPGHRLCRTRGDRPCERRAR